MAYYTLELLIVYNINREETQSFFNKLINSSKNPCHLIRITENAFGVKGSWKKFLDSLPMRVKTLYKNEFKNRYKDNIEMDKIEFPCTFMKKGDLLEPFVSKAEIESVDSVDELIDVFYENLINK